MGTDPDYARRIGLSSDGVPLPELGRMERGAMFGRLFAGVTAVRAAEDMLAAGFEPDLVVRECTELGGYLLAEQLGLPCVTLDIAPLVQARHPGMLPWLNESRAALGLPPIEDTSALAGSIWVSWLPESWYPEKLRSPAHRYYRTPDEPAQVLDTTIAGLPADRPFVLATLGSNTWVDAPREVAAAPHNRSSWRPALHRGGGAGPGVRQSRRLGWAATRQCAPGVVRPTAAAAAEPATCS